MRKATALLALTLMLFAGQSYGQDVEYAFTAAPSEDLEAPYTPGIHSGARAVAGPYDLDGDGLSEVLLSDYSGGGRVHVVENTGVDSWEWVYSTPVLDSTATTGNIRAITGADLDGDGAGEVIFFSGRDFSEFNPNIADLPPGLYVFENVGDNDFGDSPASIYTFPDDLPDRWRTEQFTVVDVDGDGFQEIMFGNNGGDNRYDNWYVLSVTGDIGSGFETWVEELRLSSRESEDFDPVNRGGGSPYGIIAGDLDGDGTLEIQMHAWNNFNFTNARATGPDTYEVPGAGDPNVFLQAASSDHVSLFGGVAVDVNGDGDDEMFFPNLFTGAVSILNYESGENPLEITTDNLILDAIPDLSALGITAGDWDQDETMDLIGSGPSYTAEMFVDEAAPVWIRVAEFIGGDPEDPANYQVSDVEFPDMRDPADFDLVVRDSAGVVTEYYESGAQGPEFVSKLAFLGDADGDGENEIAIAFQGVDDSTYVYDEVFNPSDSTYTRTVREVEANPNRTFLLILSTQEGAVAVEDEADVPTGFVLHQNYPNPFNPSTSIRFTLPVDKRVSVNVYDVMGRLVKTLVRDAFMSSGTHTITWDGTNETGVPVASGTYLYTLEYDHVRQSRQMLLVK